MLIQVFAADGSQYAYEGNDVTYKIEGSTLIVYPHRKERLYRDLMGNSHTIKIADEDTQFIYFNPTKVIITKGK